MCRRRNRTTIIVRVRFDENIVRWVQERQHYGFRGDQPASEGDAVVMTYEVNALSEIVPWLLQWGAAAIPLEPPELRELIRQEAERLLQRLGP